VSARPALVSVLVAAAALAAAPGAGGAAKAPVVDQLVVFPSGKVVHGRVSTRAATVKVHGKRCRVGGGTALPALLRSHPGRVRLRDFGSCSRKAADGSGLFVSGIGRFRNKGRDGWVYKVGRRSATAGAADPAGPFGSGRIRSAKRVTWFYCRLKANGCQRSLALGAKPEPGGIAVTVTGHDDEGRGAAEPQAAVVLGGREELTGAGGVAHLSLSAGSYRIYATKPGRVRSFTERVVVK
jgi:hypothetical protein